MCKNTEKILERPARPGAKYLELLVRSAKRPLAFYYSHATVRKAWHKKILKGLLYFAPGRVGLAVSFLTLREISL